MNASHNALVVAHVSSGAGRSRVVSSGKQVSAQAELTVGSMSL